MGSQPGNGGGLSCRGVKEAGTGNGPVAARTKNKQDNKCVSLAFQKHIKACCPSRFERLHEKVFLRVCVLFLNPGITKGHVLFGARGA